MTPYHEGIQARKDGVGPHENPYVGGVVEESGFMSFFKPRPKVDAAQAWSEGWSAEDRWQLELEYRRRYSKLYEAD